VKNRLSSLWNAKAVWMPWGLLLLFLALKTSDIWCQLGSAHFAMPYDTSCDSAWGYIDTYLSYWLDWWAEMWIWGGKPSLFFSDLVNYPLGGASALSYSMAFLHTLLVGLIQPAVGPSAAINLVVMLGLALSLAAIFFVVRAVSGNGYLSAALAILVVTYGLARGNCLLDPELTFLAYTAFALFAWSRYVERGGWRWLAVAAFLIGFTGFAHAYYGIALLACLGTAVVVSFCGVSFSGLESGTMLRRSSIALAVGLGLTLLFHARNVGNLLSVDKASALQNWFSPPWGDRYTIVDGALVVGSALAPAAVGWLWRIPNAAVWGLMCLPVAVISLGVNLHGWGPDQSVNMPLHWAREYLPFIWRLTFPQRFVAPLLVGMAISYGALWRGLAASGATAEDRPVKQGPMVGIALVAVFWITAALVPITPDTSADDSRPIANAMSDAAQADRGAPGSGGMPGGPVPPPGGTIPLAPVATGQGPSPHSLFRLPKVPAKALFWPFQPVRMVPLPPTPECVQFLAKQEGEFAVLELTQDSQRGYIEYFQTLHRKAVAGFVGLPTGMAGLYSKPSELAVLQERFRKGELNRLPDPEWLRELGLRYVVHYDVPGPDGWMAFEAMKLDEAPPPVPRPLRRFDFEAVYGPARCTDAVTRVYEIAGR